MCLDTKLSLSRAGKFIVVKELDNFLTNFNSVFSVLYCCVAIEKLIKPSNFL